MYQSIWSLKAQKSYPLSEIPEQKASAQFSWSNKSGKSNSPIKVHKVHKQVFNDKISYDKKKNLLVRTTQQRSPVKEFLQIWLIHGTMSIAASKKNVHVHVHGNLSNWLTQANKACAKSVNKGNLPFIHTIQ